MRSQRTSGKMHLKRRIVVCPFALLYNTPKYTNTDFDQTNERFTCDKQQVTYQHNTDMSRSITPYGLCHTERQRDTSGSVVGTPWGTEAVTQTNNEWQSGTLSLITCWHQICHSSNIPRTIGCYPDYFLFTSCIFPLPAFLST